MNFKLPILAPSILAADKAQLGTQVQAVLDGGAQWIHCDIMDGHFVPNITIGPDVVKSLRQVTTLPFDVHLMVSPVDQFIPLFADAGADIITVHQEAGPHLHRSLELIRSLGKKAGVSLNPSTPATTLRYVLDSIDLILAMTVNPGFGGQRFIRNQLPKIRELRRIIDKSEHTIELEVDGGVTFDNAMSIAEAGATVIVAGTASFKGGADSYAKNISMLKSV